MKLCIAKDQQLMLFFSYKIKFVNSTTHTHITSLKGNFVLKSVLIELTKPNMNLKYILRF